jgi:DNA replication regulator DPB11
MGATIKLDLTSDVTHLVVGSTESAKYRYVAKSREDVKVLSPTWLEALREVWMDGDDNMDMAALETQHRLPTFFGHKICLTGFDNRKRRSALSRAATDRLQRNSVGTSRRRSTATGLSTTAI